MPREIEARWRECLAGRWQPPAPGVADLEGELSRLLAARRARWIALKVRARRHRHAGAMVARRVQSDLWRRRSAILEVGLRHDLAGYAYILRRLSEVRSALARLRGADGPNEPGEAMPMAAE